MPKGPKGEKRPAAVKVTKIAGDVPISVEIREAGIAG